MIFISYSFLHMRLDYNAKVIAAGISWAKASCMLA